MLMLGKLHTRVHRETVLRTLKENREQHEAVVAEARKGYLKRARRALEAKLDLLEEGKVTELVFALQPPVEHLDAYNTAIEMLEWSQDELIELSAQQFRSLVMDEWEWSHTFYGVNKAYSGQAHTVAEQKGW